MQLGGNKPKVSDEEFVLPSRRRNLFEHGEDITRLNWYLMVISVCSLVLAAVLGTVLLYIYYQPPYVLLEDEGYVMYRKTEAFILDETRIRTYLTVVLSKLLNSNPGVYDLSDVAPLIDPAVIKLFTSQNKERSPERLQSNERTLFQIYDVRRFYDAEFPKQIAAAVRGDYAVFRDVPVTLDNGQTVTSTRATDEVITYKVYMEYLNRPTPTNPWGLVTTAIQKPYPEEANAIWKMSIPFFKTVLPDGRLIPKVKRDELMKEAKKPSVTP